MSTCEALKGGLVCTRPPGHDGQHEAWGMRDLLAEWP